MSGEAFIYGCGCDRRRLARVMGWLVVGLCGVLEIGMLCDCYRLLSRPSIQYSVACGNAAAVTAYLKAGGDADARSLSQSLLMIAARSNQIDTAKLLLAAGASVSEVNDVGETPLHLAAEAGNAEMARLLLDNGADASAREWSGNKTPAELAKRDWATSSGTAAFPRKSGQ
jgi:ankyrin repeat protein